MLVYLRVLIRIFCRWLPLSFVVSNPPHPSKKPKYTPRYTSFFRAKPINGNSQFIKQRTHYYSKLSQVCVVALILLSHDQHQKVGRGYFLFASKRKKRCLYPNSGFKSHPFDDRTKLGHLSQFSYTTWLMVDCLGTKRNLLIERNELLTYIL